MHRTYYYFFITTTKSSSLNLYSCRVASRKLTGDCADANPIDACWRCQPDWEANRMKLADCVMGFGRGRGTTGGKDGKIYVVTDPSDSDPANPAPGTLRFGAIQKEPLWITFEKDMTISLTHELLIASDKTIDGRGANVEISNSAQITIYQVKNVIIHGITIQNMKVTDGGQIKDSVDHVASRGPSEGDGIMIFASCNVWIDHCTMASAVDGLLDVKEGSTAVTISNCHFSKHDKVSMTIKFNKN